MADLDFSVLNNGIRIKESKKAKTVSVEDLRKQIQGRIADFARGVTLKEEELFSVVEAIEEADTIIAEAEEDTASLDGLSDEDKKLWMSRFGNVPQLKEERNALAMRDRRILPLLAQVRKRRERAAELEKLISEGSPINAMISEALKEPQLIMLAMEGQLAWRGQRYAPLTPDCASFFVALKEAAEEERQEKRTKAQDVAQRMREKGLLITVEEFKRMREEQEVSFLEFLSGDGELATAGFPQNGIVLRRRGRQTYIVAATDSRTAQTAFHHIDKTGEETILNAFLVDLGRTEDFSHFRPFIQRVLLEQKRFEEERKSFDFPFEERITSAELFGGKKGICYIHVPRWRAGAKEVDLLVALEGDGDGKCRILRSGRDCEDLAIFTIDSKSLKEWMPTGMVAKDRRWQVAFGKNAYHDTVLEVRRISANTDVRSLKYEEALKDLLAMKAGRYFLDFFNLRYLGNPPARYAAVISVDGDGLKGLKVEPVGEEARCLKEYGEAIGSLNELRGPAKLAISIIITSRLGNEYLPEGWKRQEAAPAAK